jgi:DnaJ-class molecular chaperone
MNNPYDLNKNYYQTLGVEISASNEELKAAYVKLALKYHPDTSEKDRDDAEFHEISEAWSVLSKPDIRKNYDNDRRRLDNDPYGTNIVSSSSTTSDDYINHHIPPTFITARDNYTTTVKKNASSNWRELQDKYRLEKWQKLSLKTKKEFRSRSVTSGLGLGVLVVVGIPMITLCFWSYRNFVSTKQTNYRSNK